MFAENKKNTLEIDSAASAVSLVTYINKTTCKSIGCECEHLYVLHQLEYLIRNSTVFLLAARLSEIRQYG